ncbi:MAG: hypothetical protein C0467_27620 [Planctomycetaceae bacterium]|nr:hypothetical protein [Planctomycetaceae bacterium]
MQLEGAIVERFCLPVNGVYLVVERGRRCGGAAGRCPGLPHRPGAVGSRGRRRRHRARPAARRPRGPGRRVAGRGRQRRGGPRRHPAGLLCGRPRRTPATGRSADRPVLAVGRRRGDRGAGRRRTPNPIRPLAAVGPRDVSRAVAGGGDGTGPRRPRHPVSRTPVSLCRAARPAHLSVRSGVRLPAVRVVSPAARRAGGCSPGGVRLGRPVAGRVRAPAAAGGGVAVAVGDVTGTLRHVAADLPAGGDYARVPGDLDAVRAALPAAGRVHFAGHGVFNPDHPYRSGWVVEAWPRAAAGPFGGRSRYGEELLTVAAVLAEVEMPRCRLVVMASCSSGLPSRHPAGELTGLPAAFLAAGVDAVVGAQWPVADAAAAALMRIFYARLDDDPDPARVLAAARVTLGRLDRAAAAALLGSGRDLPRGEFPFAGAECRLAFLHFGAGGGVTGPAP